LWKTFRKKAGQEGKKKKKVGRRKNNFIPSSWAFLFYSSSEG